MMLGCRAFRLTLLKIEYTIGNKIGNHNWIVFSSPSIYVFYAYFAEILYANGVIELVLEEDLRSTKTNDSIYFWN